MKKTFAILLALCLVLALSVGAVAEGYTPGTYTAESRGMKPMKLEVTFTENAIESVVIAEHGETYGIGYGIASAPVEAIPAWIVENQSLGCDTVSGATITTYAIVNGVADAVKQAGGDADALKAKKAEATAQDQTIECDVVVAGAGAAGLGAAIAAVENGASVVLLEEQGVTGGSTTRSGGYFLAAGTQMQKDAGIEDTPEALFDFYKGIGGDLLNDEKVMDFCQNSAATFDWIVSNGAKFDSVVTVHPTHTVLRVHNSLGGAFMGAGQGGQMTAPMTNSYLEKGGKLIYNAEANALLLDEQGNVCGIKAAMRDGGTLTVKAKAVVLATGGYAGDQEKVNELHFSQPSGGNVPKTNTGDAAKMVEAVDGKVEWTSAANITMVSGTTGVGCFGEADGMIISAEGERVCNEYCYFYSYTEALLNAGSAYGWYITDADDKFPTTQYAMTMASTPSADTAEELAALIGADPAKFAAAVARYNEHCAAGVDADYGKPVDFLNALDKKLYAIKLTPGISGTYGGVLTDVESQVINNAGEIVPGLYAAGEASFNGLVGTEYPVCGTAIGTAFYFGKVAGENAAAFAAK